MEFQLFLAEDEEWTRKAVKAVIDWDGLHMALAGDAADGREALKQIANKQVDILLTDIRMPFVNGLQLAEEAQRVHPGLKVIIISGYKDFEYAKDAIRLGAVDYLLKPIDEEELNALLKKTCRDISRQYLDSPEQPTESAPENASMEEMHCMVCVARYADGSSIRKCQDAFEQRLKGLMPEKVEWSVNRKSECEFLVIFYFYPADGIEGCLLGTLRVAVSVFQGKNPLLVFAGKTVNDLRSMHIS